MTGRTQQFIDRCAIPFGWSLVCDRSIHRWSNATLLKSRSYAINIDICVPEGAFLQSHERNWIQCSSDGGSRAPITPSIQRVNAQQVQCLRTLNLSKIIAGVMYAVGFCVRTHRNVGLAPFISPTKINRPKLYRKTTKKKMCESRTTDALTRLSSMVLIRRRRHFVAIFANAWSLAGVVLALHEKWMCR